MNIKDHPLYAIRAYNVMKTDWDVAWRDVNKRIDETMLQKHLQIIREAEDLVFGTVYQDKVGKVRSKEKRLRRRVQCYKAVSRAYYSALICSNYLIRYNKRREETHEDLISCLRIFMAGAKLLDAVIVIDYLLNYTYLDVALRTIMHMNLLDTIDNYFIATGWEKVDPNDIANVFKNGTSADMDVLAEAKEARQEAFFHGTSDLEEDDQEEWHDDWKRTINEAARAWSFSKQFYGNQYGSASIRARAEQSAELPSVFGANELSKLDYSRTYRGTFFKNPFCAVNFQVSFPNINHKNFSRNLSAFVRSLIEIDNLNRRGSTKKKDHGILGGLVIQPEWRIKDHEQAEGEMIWTIEEEKFNGIHIKC